MKVMRRINHIIPIFFVLMVFSSCEYFDPQTTSGGTTKGFISFPVIEITILGEQYVTIQVGDTYEDLGATATWDGEDATDSIVVVTDLDVNTAGIYPIDYVIININEIGDESVFSNTRWINVTPTDVSDVDLSGSFLGVGFSSAPSPKNIVRLGTGWFQTPDVLGSGNGIVGFFAVNGDQIILPDQPTPFGNINTTADGTFGTLGADRDSWEWVVFIGCCGNFPRPQDPGDVIAWTRQ